MKYVYPIIIKETDKFFNVYVPDLDINTQGKDLADAIVMARDAIGMWGCFEQDENRKIPLPSKLGTINHENDDIVTLVDVDFDEYRKKHENRTIRKNLTLPSWLNEEAERAGINFSAVLQSALKAQLNIRE